MTNNKLRLGTRKSPMAAAVAEHARNLIQNSVAFIDVDIFHFVSDGDKIDGDLKNFGGKGTFIKDLEARLLRDEIDCAIHALKDIPGDVPMHDDLMLVAFLPREDARDALVLRKGITEEQLRMKNGAIIGTSAPRRQAAVRHLFPNASSLLVRGNVNTRMKKLDDGLFDALILSGAGLERVGFRQRISRYFEDTEILPAVGQGILCIQIKKINAEKLAFLTKINSKWSEQAATAEREILFSLKGNCHSAIAAHCKLKKDNSIVLTASVFDQNSSKSISTVITATDNTCDYRALGQEAAHKLINLGASSLL